MPLDTFICGSCQGAFSDIEAFMNHKKDGCFIIEQEAFHVSKDVNLDNTAPLVSVVGDVGTSTDITYFNEGIPEGTNAILTSDSTNHAQQTIVIIKGEDIENLTSDKATCTVDMEPKAPRKRGRPKSSGKKKVEPVEKKGGGRPLLPEPGADGKYVCVRCKRSFGKERFFNTHKCLSADYVDITKKEIFSPELDGDDEQQDAGEIDDEAIDEYTAPIVLNVDSGDEIMEDIDKIEDFENKKTAKTFKSKLANVEIISDPDVENTITKKLTDSIEDLPIFTDESSKLEFETVLNVDLSAMDSMYTRHCIAQELDESAISVGKNVNTELSLYLCNICSKVFKTVSHIRHHCLIHTDIKPFKCLHCAYKSNSKGNLYTHMRIHTGQMYHCQKCSFNSVNKSHLIEHEATHSNTRHLCNLCKKDYNTQKSLINHIRKYHLNTEMGKEYLALFLNRKNSQSHVIHQCHVCNRKFKKKIDRDRHLFVHDIKDIPIIQKCELCDYTASRRLYLEKHYLKHRIIYRCCSCPARFLSSVRLIDHLNTKHSELSSTWETLFEQCIENSIYLPEPDDKLGFGSEIINLPPELSKTSIELLDAKKLDGDSNMSKDEITLETETAVEDHDVQESTNRNDESMEIDCPLVITSGSLIDGNVDPTSTTTGDSTMTNELVKSSDSAISTLANNETAQTHTNETASTSNNGTHSPDPNNETVLTETNSEIASNQINSETTQRNIEPAQSKDLPSVKPSDETSNYEEQPTISKDDTDSNSVEMTETQENNSSPLNTVIKQENGVETITEDVADNIADDITDDVISKSADESEVININGENIELINLENELNEEKNSNNIDHIVNKLGYRTMTMNIFHKMRETFGSEECEYCGRLFYNKPDFEAHLRIHTGERPFQCDHCSYRALNSNVLKKHVEKEHEKIMYECSDCDFTTFKRGTLWNHRIKHLTIVGLECPKCSAKLDSMKRLRSHLLESHPGIEMEELEKLTGYRHRLHGKMGRRSYKCPYCEKIFTRANSELQKHIWMHEGIKPFKCSLCTYSCRSKNNLQAHMLRHSAEKPFCCEECGKAYKSRTALRWHVRSHKDGKMFKCTKCNYEAAQRSHLTRHMETHNVVKRFACQACDYSANTLQFMKIHYARNHKGEKFDVDAASEATRPEQSSDAKVFKCLSCDYLFGNMYELKRHLRLRHNVPSEDIANLEAMEMSEVQVVQYVDENPVQQEVVDSSETMVTELQQQTVEEDEKTVSAVSLLQQIMNMSYPGGYNQQQQQHQQVTLVNEDGQMVAVNPDTIIVQENGEEVLVTDSNSQFDGNQYVIQYVSQQDTPLDTTIPQEIITSEEIQ